MEQPNFFLPKQLFRGDQVLKKILDIIKMEYPNERDTYLDNIAVNNFGLAANNA
jgi:hypothetical protein